MEIIYQPWSWFVSGFLIALFMFLLLLLGKRFGMSSNLRAFCSMCGGGKVSSFLITIGKKTVGIYLLWWVPF